MLTWICRATSVIGGKGRHSPRSFLARLPRPSLLSYAKGIPIRLNFNVPTPLTAAEINRTALASEKRKTPVDLIGGKRQGHIDPKIRATVLEAEIGFLTSARPETIKGDDYPLKKYDSDGYPELHVGLDRRRPLRQCADVRH
jgi:hypothetical protein